MNATLINNYKNIDLYQSFVIILICTDNMHIAYIILIKKLLKLLIFEFISLQNFVIGILKLILTTFANEFIKSILYADC